VSVRLICRYLTDIVMLAFHCERVASRQGVIVQAEVYHLIKISNLAVFSRK